MQSSTSSMSSLRDSLLGTWRLIDVCVFRKGETQEVIYSMWKTALGSLIYSPDGYMWVSRILATCVFATRSLAHRTYHRAPNPTHRSVQFMASGADAVSGDHQFTATTDELADAAHRYIAYTGLFDVTDADPAGAVVRHTLQLASIPNLVGTVQRRLISFEDSVEGKVLVLKAENATTFLSEGEIVVLKWTKVAK